MLQFNSEYNYSFKLYQTRQSLELLSDEWRALIGRAGAGVTPFQTPEWCITWLEMNPDAKPCIVAVYQNARLIFLAPLMQARSIFGVKTLCFLSGADCAYGNIICDGETDAGQLFEDMSNWLQDEGVCDLLRLDNIAAHMPWIASHKNHLGKSDLAYSSLLTLNDSLKQDYFSTLHKLVRRDVRHSTRQLERMGELTIEVVECDQYWREEVLPQLIEWKMSWLKSSGRWGGGMFNGSMMRFLSNLAKNCETGGLGARSSVVKLNGKVITANLVLVHDRSIYGYFSSFDPALKKVSLGTLRDIRLVEWMLNEDYTAFDLLGHPEAYKDRIANQKTTLVNLAMPLTRRGKLAAFWARIKLRNRAKQVFLRLPDPLRRTIISLLRR